mmetsp:Transcript_25909/g.55136  ORF Transcript_25909/g.55136 Transcript_25909/m.55136 type:complete len:196 (+) Transcript_25909:93-680(+)|eukprot:CAMPEP_0172526188 /NCGR_PEP_ID=MMETSP1067-20121228/1148_1 /TAXON_ID=265564 ORGANISM="Thalassiosira punctigera, Strain Tpunct2005C2" /NCGR_SAMPLE_ID=MMETSP1067 /ASSEMBLY_ACC=CAM_ASM_000444 /LENGTH=195 /DNA_ID=CAMNT_0013309637 /DNA_START=61 /DNA_END=648 /DNA_ORIENTATION=+
MNRFTCTIALLASASTADALVTNQSTSKHAFSDRRAFFGVIGGAAAAAVAVAAPPAAQAAGAIKTGPSNPFTGDYDDPNHPGCLRQVKVVGAPQKADGSKPLYANVEVVGYDGKGGSKTCTDRPTRDDLWKVTGKTKGKEEAFLDFSSKGGPSNLVATWDGSGIVFPDGNKWTKLTYAPRDRRPKDMSTLSEGPL